MVLDDEDDWDAPRPAEEEGVLSIVLGIGTKVTDGSLAGEYVYRAVKRCARAGALLSSTSALERRPDIASQVFLEAAQQLHRAAERIEEAARCARIAERQGLPLHALKVPEEPGEKKTTVQ